MEITDLKIIERNKIEVSDALKIPLLRMKVEIDTETIVPESNNLIVYVNEKTYTFNLTSKLNVGDIFEIKPVFNGKKIEQTAVVKRNDNTIETLTYKDIILNEGQNTLRTNYENALIEVVYPKDTDLVNYFLTTMTTLTTPSTGNISIEEIANELYPIGSIYISVNNINPSELFGGTWEAWGAGKVPVGVNTNETEFNIVEKTGGSKDLQKHSHTFYRTPSNGESTWIEGVVRFKYDVAPTTQTNTYIGNVNECGTGTSGNLMPYITCYMWKRTE